MEDDRYQHDVTYSGIKYVNQDVTHTSQTDMQADIHKCDYVIVSYDGKKTVCHYIGFVLDEKDDDGDLEVRFLRKSNKTENAHVEPAIYYYI